MNTYWVILCVAIALGSYSLSVNAVTNFTIAGVFNHFDENGNSIHDQLEHVFAFTMAVDYVNSRKDLFPNIHLDHVIKNVNNRSNAIAVAETINDHHFPSKLSGIVSTIPYDSLKMLAEVTQEKQTIVMNVLVNDIATNATAFPYVINMLPLTSYYGNVYTKVLCGIAHQILYVATTVPKHIDYLNEMISVGSTCGIANLGSYVVKAASTDFTSTISQIAGLQPAILTVIMDDKDKATFLSQAYDQGLLRTGVTLYIHNVDNMTTFMNSFPSYADIPAILYGSSIAEGMPGFSMTRSAAGLQFLNDWTSLPNAKMECPSYTDSENSSYLMNNNGQCYGIDFSTYSSSGSNTNPLLVYTYDAVITMAYGLSNITTAEKTCTGLRLRNVLLDSTRTGASGIIGFSKGDATNDMFGRGGRIHGVNLNLKNFHQDAYAINPLDAFVGTYLFPSEGSILPCQYIPNYGSCGNYIFNNPLNSFDGYPPYTLQTLPSYIKIGAMFSPIDENGHVDHVQVEMLAAFIFAIDKMNARTDLLPSTSIVYELQLGSGFTNTLQSAQNLNDAFYNTGVIAVISGLGDAESIAAHSVFTNDGQLFQIDAIARDSKLSNAVDFPYKAQISPVYSFDGHVIQDIICRDYKYANIGVFYSNDANGMDGYDELTSGASCMFDVQFKYEVILEEVNSATLELRYAEIIKKAKASGIRVFVFLLPGARTAEWLYRGYEGDLFSSETQVFISSVDLTSVASTLYQFSATEADMTTTPTAKVASIMKGVVAIDYWPDATFRQTTAGKEFIQTWRSQPYSGSSYNDGRMVCDRTTDSSGTTFLHQTLDGSTCFGLNFTAYDATLSTISPHVLAMYDSVESIAIAFNALMLEDPTRTTSGGDDVREAMVNSLEYTGLTGAIGFYEGDADSSYKTRCDRRVGLIYKVINFNEEAFFNNINESFVQVGVWRSDYKIGIESCDSDDVISSDILCTDQAMVYRTATNEPPSDTRPDLIEPMPVAGVAVLMLVFAAGIIMTLVVMVLTYVHRRHKLIKAAQPEMLACILIGVVFGLLKVMIGALPITDSSCTAGLWMAHLAFALGVGSLMIKTYRVHCVLNIKTLKRVKFTARKVLAMMAVALLITVVWLIVLTAVSKPHLSYVSSTSDNQTTKLPQCSMDYPAIHTVMMLLEGLVVIVGGRLCYAIKDVPSALNESKNIAAAITFIGMISALVFPIVFLLGVDPSIRQIIASISFGFATLFTMLVIFAPKFMEILDNSKVNDIVGRPGSYEMNVKQVVPITVNNGSTNTQPTFDSTVAAKNAMKKLSSEAKVNFCMEQISKWQAMMLNINIQQDLDGSSHEHVENHDQISDYSSPVDGAVADDSSPTKEAV